MDNALKIFIDQLKDGKVEEINLEIPPAFLEVNEPDLAFNEEITVSGEAYIAEEELVLHLNLETVAAIPCAICNEPVNIPIAIEGLYHVEPLENIKDGIFNIQDVIRENVLLESPIIAECHEGKCPQRKELSKYLKKSSSENEEDEGYHPFSNLKLE